MRSVLITSIVLMLLSFICASIVASALLISEKNLSDEQTYQATVNVVYATNTAVEKALQQTATARARKTASPSQ